MRFNYPAICILMSLIILQNANAQSKQKLTNASLNGAWEMVWSNEKENPTGKAMEFKLYHDGFFSVLWQDSPGKWNHGAAGVYNITGSALQQVVKYDTDSSYINWQFWQSVELIKDTLYTKVFYKVINPKGEDVSSKWGDHVREKWIRAKNELEQK
jgi:hypothetical protein